MTTTVDTTRSVPVSTGETLRVVTAETDAVTTLTVLDNHRISADLVLVEPSANTGDRPNLRLPDTRRWLGQTVWVKALPTTVGAPVAVGPRVREYRDSEASVDYAASITNLTSLSGTTELNWLATPASGKHTITDDNGDTHVVNFALNQNYASMAALWAAFTEGLRSSSLVTIDDTAHTVTTTVRGAGVSIALAIDAGSDSGNRLATATALATTTAGASTLQANVEGGVLNLWDDTSSGLYKSALLVATEDGVRVLSYTGASAPYDNTASSLTATTVQDAIDELKALIDAL